MLLPLAFLTSNSYPRYSRPPGSRSCRELDLRWAACRPWRRLSIQQIQGQALPISCDPNGVKLGEGSRFNKKYMVRPMTAFSTSTPPASLLMWHLCLSHLGEASL